MASLVQPHPADNETIATVMQCHGDTAHTLIRTTGSLQACFLSLTLLFNFFSFFLFYWHTLCLCLFNKWKDKYMFSHSLSIVPVIITGIKHVTNTAISSNISTQRQYQLQNRRARGPFWYISVSLTNEQFKKKEQELQVLARYEGAKETVCVYVCAPYMRPRFPQEPTAASRFLGIWKDFKIIT